MGYYEKAMTKYIEVVAIPQDANLEDQPRGEPEFSFNVLRCEESVIDCPDKSVIKNMRFQLTKEAKKAIAVYEAIQEALAEDDGWKR